MDNISTYQSNKQKVEFLLDQCDEYRKYLFTDSAVAIGRLALEMAKNENDERLSSKAQNFIGLCYRDVSRFNYALSYFKKGLEHAIKSKDTIQIAYSYYNIGGVELTLSNFIEAAQEVLAAKDLFEKIDYQNGVAHCCIKMGLIYKAQKQYEKAKSYFSDAGKIRRMKKDSVGYAMAVFMMAEAYYESDELDKAKKLYISADSLLNNTSSRYSIYRSTIYMGLSGIFYELKNYNLALDYRYKALEILDKAKKIHDLIMNYNAIGKIYTQIGDYEKAEKYLDTALMLSLKTNIDFRRMDVYYSFSLLNTKMGNFKKAFEYISSYSELKDSLLSSENQAELAKLENQYEKEEIEKEKESLQLQLKYYELKTKSWIYFSIFAFIILSVIFYKYKTYKQLSYKLDELNQTKDRLFSIISHDLKNPFSAILNQTDLLKKEYYSLDDKDKQELVKSVNSSAVKISDLLENLLEWAKTHWDKLDISKEGFTLYPVMKDTVALYKEAIEDKKLEISLEIDENIKVLADNNSVRMIFRNLLSNAVKFTGENGKISITSKYNGNEVMIFVEDSGIGLSDAGIKDLFSSKPKHSTDGTDGEKGHGFGLLLCKEMVEKNGGSLSVESQQGKGSKFILTLPVAT